MMRLQACVVAIQNWMFVNKLKLNADKTDAILICSPRVKNNIDMPHIGRIRLGDFRGALLGHAHMRRSRLCSTKICESNRNCIVFIEGDGSDED